MVQRERKIITIVLALKRFSTMGKGEGKEGRVRVGVRFVILLCKGKNFVCAHTCSSVYIMHAMGEPEDGAGKG